MGLHGWQNGWVIEDIVLRRRRLDRYSGSIDVS